MAKRFTETTKWSDAWFRKLSMAHKCAWSYLTDNCDHAGVIELDEGLANFQIGGEVDWDAFIDASAGRIVRLECGKLWIVKFIDFQYGELNPDCKQHAPAIKSVAKHCLPIANRMPIECQSDDVERAKDKNKNKEKNKDGGAGGDSTDSPETDRIESLTLREATQEWIEYKRERRQPYKPRSLKTLVTRVLTLADEHGEAAIVIAMQRAIASQWQGFEHDIGGGNSRGSPSYAKSRTQTALEKFLGTDHETTNDSQADRGTVRLLGQAGG